MLAVRLDLRVPRPGQLLGERFLFGSPVCIIERGHGASFTTEGKTAGGGDRGLVQSGSQFS